VIPDKTDYWRRAALFAVVLLALILPFPHNGFVRNLCLVSASLMLLLSWRLQRARLTMGPLAVGWMIYLLINFLVALFADRPGYAFREYLGEFIFPFLVYLVAVNCFTRRSAGWFVTLFVHLGVGVSLYGLVGSYLHFARVDFRYYHEFFIMDYKAFGTFLIFIIPYALQRARDSWYYRVVLLFLGFNLVITYCRSAWLAMALGVVLFFGLVWRPLFVRQNISGVVLRFAAVLLLLGLFGFAVISYSYSREGWNDFMNVSKYRQYHAIATRFRVWLNTLEMVGDNPVWGYGLGVDNYKRLYPQYKRPQDEVIWHPHNMFYRVLVEGGFMGLGGLMFILTLIVVWLWRRLTSNKTYEYELPLAVMIVAFVIRNFFDCHYMDDKLWTFWLLVGMTMAVVRQPKKLICLSWDDAILPGGIARVAQQLCYYFRRRGISASVVTKKRGSSAVSRKLHYLQMAGFYIKAMLCVGLEQPQGIIALQWYPDGRVARLIGKIYSLPYVVYAHGKELAMGKIRPKSFCEIMGAARRIVAVSQATADYLQQMKVQKEKITVLYNGLTFPELPEVVPAAKREKNIIAVGRLVKRKGIDLLLQAIPEILERGWELRIIGAGPERKNLEAQAKCLKNSSRVIFYGRVSDDVLREQYARASIFVLPARATADQFEGLGIVLLEAAAYQLPLVGTQSGGIQEIIVDGVNGILVPPADVAALRQALLRLTDDEGLRQKMGETARQTVGRFSWSETVDTIAVWFFPDISPGPSEVQNL